MALHLHAFGFVASLLDHMREVLLPAATPNAVDYVVLACILVYLVLACRRVYGGRLSLAAVRGTVLLVAYFVLGLAVVGSLLLVRALVI